MNYFTLIAFTTGLVSFVVGMATTALGVVFWYGKTETKKYAAERDFQHLKNSYQQLASNQELIIREGDNRNDEYLRRFDMVIGKMDLILVKLNGGKKDN